jgi:hypothetical protein
VKIADEAVRVGDGAGRPLIGAGTAAANSRYSGV